MCLRHLDEKAGVIITYQHQLHLYSPKIYQWGVINMTQRGSKVLITDYRDDFDRRWFKRYLVIQTKFLHTNDKIQFP